MKLVLPFTLLLLGLNAAPQTEYVSRSEDDQRAMRAFAPFIGLWIDPESESRGFEFAWGFEEKTAHLREFKIVDDEREVLAEALAGWHYGRREIVFHEFVRDHRSFESMNAGVFRGREGALLREYTSFDPNGSSRDYRERYELLPAERLTLTIEYRDDESRWRPWGVFQAERRAGLAGSSAGPADPGR